MEDGTKDSLHCKCMQASASVDTKTVYNCKAKATTTLVLSQLT